MLTFDFGAYLLSAAYDFDSYDVSCFDLFAHDHLCIHTLDWDCWFLVLTDRLLIEVI